MNHRPVLDPRLDALIEPLKADLQASGWPIYKEDTQKVCCVSWFCGWGLQRRTPTGLVVRDDQFTWWTSW